MKFATWSLILIGGPKHGLTIDGLVGDILHPQYARTAHKCRGRVVYRYRA